MEFHMDSVLRKGPYIAGLLTTGFRIKDSFSAVKGIYWFLGPFAQHLEINKMYTQKLHV